MSTTSFHQSLEQLFTRQLAAASKLTQILKDENSALLERDYDRTQQIVETKLQLTTEIESLSQDQLKLLAKADLPYSPEGLDKAIQSAAKTDAAKLEKLRNELESVMQKCQEQNLINGQIVAVNRQSAKTALAILRGQFSTEELTYGASGQPVNEQAGKPISKA